MEPPADRTTWRTAPANRWAFHHVDAILPTAPVANAPGAVRPLPPAPRSLDGFSLKAPWGEPLDLPGFLEATSTDGLVILKHGDLVFETYAESMTAQTPHILMSASKAVTGLLAGVLAHDGDLDVAALVSAYVPEIAATGYAGATIRDLLDMRAGVAVDAADYDATVSGLPLPSGEASPGFHGLLRSLVGPPAEHGRPFSYVSLNTDLLGWAMERATGRRFADLLSDRLWRPMGAEHPAYVVADAEGSAWASGGVCATVRDFARVGALMLEDGRGVVPKAWIDDLRHGGDRDAWATGEWGASFAFISREMSYRSGWYAVHAAPEHLFAMGVHGQNLFLDWKTGVVIAKLSSQPQRIDPRALALTHWAMPELIRLA